MGMPIDSGIIISLFKKNRVTDHNSLGFVTKNKLFQHKLYYLYMYNESQLYIMANPNTHKIMAMSMVFTL